MKRKIVTLFLAGTMAASLFAATGCGSQGEKTPDSGSAISAEKEAAAPVKVDQTLKMDDAAVTELNVTVDGKATKVTMYEDCYVKNPTNVAMIPNEDKIDQKVSIYVPENATKESPIIYAVNNAGWIMDAYSGRLQVEDGSDYVSTSDSDMIGMALSKGYVIASAGIRSRGDNPNADGEYISHSPATMTDAKAVIRYLRNNADLLPAGDPEKIVITGTSGGGALSVNISSQGNSEDFFESLYEIGAAGIEKADDGTYTSTINDDVFATIAYCPINDLREADAAYEFTYQDARKRLVDAGLPAVDMETKSTFQDPFTDTYTADWMLDASAALAEQYGQYVNSLGLDIKSDTLNQATLELVNESLKKTAKEVGVDKMLDDLAGNADYSGQKTTSVYNSTSKDWNDFLSFDENNVPYLKDEAALKDFFYFVARNQTLKVACAFSNKGLAEKGLASESGFNEDTLFGSSEVPYTAYEFYSWNNDAVKGNGCGLDDTGKTWDEYMETEDGKALAKQMEMASPIPYLLSDNGQSAPYWYVRHGMRDRDTAFSLQTVLYHALKNDASIKDLNFSLAWLQPHAGDYDVQEAYAWLDSVLKK